MFWIPVVIDSPVPSLSGIMMFKMGFLNLTWGPQIHLLLLSSSSLATCGTVHMGHMHLQLSRKAATMVVRPRSD